MERTLSSLLGCVLVVLFCVTSTLPSSSFGLAEDIDAVDKTYDDFENFCADLAPALPSYRGYADSESKGEGKNASRSSKREGEEMVLINVLLDWCVDDRECKEIYHQSYRKNMTIFKQLLAPQMEPFRLGTKTPDLHYLTRGLFCEGKNAHDISKILWLQMMKTDIGHSTPQCDINHRLVYDDRNMVFQCVCKEDKACDSDELFDLIPFYVVVGLVLLLVIIGVSSHVVRTFVVWRTLENANKRAKEVERRDGGGGNDSNDNNKVASHNYLLTVLEHVMG